MEIVTA